MKRLYIVFVAVAALVFFIGAAGIDKVKDDTIPKSDVTKVKTEEQFRKETLENQKKILKELKVLKQNQAKIMSDLKFIRSTQNP